MKNLKKNDIILAWSMAEFELRIYNSGNFSPYYFLRRIISFLRSNPNFCKTREYKELYDECMVLLILHNHAYCGWTYKEPKRQWENIELLIDLEAGQLKDDDNLSYHTVKNYLDHRKKHWENGEKYTKEEYGFI